MKNENGAVSPGDILKKVRHSRKLYMHQVGEKMGITEGYVSRIENGSRKSNKRVIEKIAEFVGVSPDTISFLSHGIPAELQDEDLIMYQKIKQKLSNYLQ